MNGFWQIVLGIIASVGGGGIIVAGFARFAGKVWSERYIQSKEQEFQGKLEAVRAENAKELDKLRAQIDKSIFISRTQFETEYKMYIQIFDSIFDFIASSCRLFPAGLNQYPADEAERKQHFINQYEEFQGAYNVYSRAIETNAPFIKREIYAKLIKLRNDSNEIACLFPEIRIINDERFSEDYNKIIRENCKKTSELQKAFETLKDEVRNYLDSQKLLE
jgi:hypothetical protein